jgi:hypothetical protein
MTAVPVTDATVRLELHTVAVLEKGCFSVLKWDGKPIAVSLEHTFEDGRPVIAAGEYWCTRDYYHKGGYETFEIQVVGHDRVLFHIGNTEMDSRGCVLVGERFGKDGVLDSRSGFAEFMRLTSGLPAFKMRVTNR